MWPGDILERPLGRPARFVQEFNQEAWAIWLDSNRLDGRSVTCCDRRRYVSRKTDDYRAGLFFCPECSRGYELTIERHKIVDARPFAR